MFRMSTIHELRAIEKVVTSIQAGQEPDLSSIHLCSDIPDWTLEREAKEIEKLDRYKRTQILGRLRAAIRVLEAKNGRR